MIKNIIFDLDGTLADTIPLILSAVNQVAEQKLHRGFSRQDYLRIRDMSIKEMLFHEHINPIKVPFYIRKIRKIVRNTEQKPDLFPGIKRLIPKLSKKYVLGIITTNSEEVARQVIKNNRLEGFSFVISANLILGKSRKICMAIRKMGLKPEETIYVGDEVRDIQACRKAGIKIISVTWGNNTKKRLEQEKPDYIAKNVPELEKIILNL